MKTYFLAYGNDLGTRDELKSVLNSIPEIKGWRYDMPNTFYIHSEMPHGELISLIRSKCGGKGRCLLIEMGSQHGWLPKDTWAFIHKFEREDEGK